MQLNFLAILAALGPGAAFRIANSARAPGDYLFNTLLPEEQRFGYHVESGTMTIRSTMAGLAGMDSPYPPGGMVDTSTFAEQTAKIANQVPLNEQTLRHLQEMALRLSLMASPTNEALVRQVLNFLDKVIVQPHLDTAEWLRGQCLTSGAIDWTFGKIHLEVDYGIDGSHKLTPRTGNDAYNGSTSKFAVDEKAARRLLKKVRARIAHPTMIDAIRYNTENEFVTIAETENSVTLRRIIPDTGAFTNDAADTLTFISYDKEAEVLDPANPNATKLVPFMPENKILYVGENRVNAFGVGIDQGSTEDPNLTNRLGYTHIAPTVEGGGRPGRWSDLFTPQHEPYQLVGRGVTNLLPVLENPDKVVILESTTA